VLIRFDITLSSTAIIFTNNLISMSLNYSMTLLNICFNRGYYRIYSVNTCKGVKKIIKYNDKFFVVVVVYFIYYIFIIIL
jgi:hypothetical protein